MTNRIQHFDMTAVQGGEPITTYYVSFVFQNTAFNSRETGQTMLRLLQIILIEQGENPLSPGDMWDAAANKISEEWPKTFFNETYNPKDWSVVLHAAKYNIYQPPKRR